LYAKKPAPAKRMKKTGTSTPAMMAALLWDFADIDAMNGGDVVDVVDGLEDGAT